MRFFTTVLLLVAATLTSVAQRNCGTSAYHFSRPDAAGDNSNTSGIRRDTLPGETIIIPVVVHVLYNTAAQNISDAQVLSQIECLNNDFNHLNIDTLNTPVAFRKLAADCRIRFCLAKVDPNGRLATGIVRRSTPIQAFMDESMKFSGSGGSSAWDSRRYLNIWVCNMGGRSLGFASFPGGPADRDGVVINFDVFGTKGTLRAPFNKGRTTTHEVGHWMGLRHIWGDVLCGDDGIDDTPRQKSYNFGCPSFPRLTNCSGDGNGDMFMNFMDFSDDACMNLFTHGQKAIMRGQFALNGQRNGFLDAGTCDSANATSGPAPEETEAPVPAAPAFDFTTGPNPTHSYIVLKAAEGTELTGRVFRIFNSQGQPVMQFSCSNEGQQVNISSLASGLYLVVTGSGKHKIVKKIIKN